jgi:thiamine kinase-like enzyme
LNVTEIGAYVRAYFVENAGTFGLRPETLEARYVLNRGGFVNHSYTITDGACAYHLKLAEDEWCQSALRRWHALRDILESRYRAPKIVGWVDLPETDCCGALFEQIDGRVPDLAADRSLLQQVLSLVRTLHADSELAERVRGFEEAWPRTFFAHYRETYIERFEEDLEIISGEIPPFVSDKTLAWMYAETRQVEAMARQSPAFDRETRSIAHSDLWANNILQTPAGDWYLLDWDDMCPGDPAMDYSLLLWSLARDHPLDSVMLAGLPEEDPLRERMGLYFRTMLLDEVIDVLADYVEVEKAPEHREAVRAEKRRIHEESLALYLQRYGA